jgi:xanthine/CO dehydrogenase XdhC/CoxF family maturation factor
MRELCEILERVRALAARPAPAALATIVRAEGSSYRREGARMLLEADGTATGVLSGGCLEADLARAAAAAIAAGAPRTVIYDLQAEEEAVWGFGLGCEGKVTLLVEPLDAAARSRLARELETLLVARREVRTAIVFAAESATGRVDVPAVAERLEAETCAPAWRESARAALDALEPGEARAVRLDAPGGGAAWALIESLLPPPHLLVFGGERDAAPLLALGRELGWETTVVVARPPERSAAARLARYARLVVAAPRQLARAGVELSPRTAAVVATHRYLDDLAFLGELAAAAAAGEAAPAYLAVLGPARRRDRLLADLERQGHAAGAPPLAGLHGPAGLALGGRSPVEVALSIVAEIQAALAGGAVRPLSAPAAAREAGELALPPGGSRR